MHKICHNNNNNYSNNDFTKTNCIKHTFSKSVVFWCLVWLSPTGWILGKLNKWPPGLFSFSAGIAFKGNAQFLILCYSQTPSASSVYTTFIRINKKIMTADMFHWLKLITVILSYVRIFNWKKTSTHIFFSFSMFQKIC